MEAKKLTRFFNTLRLCEACYLEYVIEYAIALDPVFDANDIGICDICGKTAILKVFKYVTVLNQKSLNTRKSLNIGRVYKQHRV